MSPQLGLALDRFQPDLTGARKPSAPPLSRLSWPNIPSVELRRQFLREYSVAATSHLRAILEDPEGRHAWPKQIHLGAPELEREFFLSGRHRAFLLFMDS
jgi:hypothetical protein